MKSVIASWFLLLIVCIQNQSFGQTFQSIGTTYGAGTILKIYPTFPEKGLHQHTSVSLGWKNESVYSQAYKHHENLVSLSVHDFGNRAVLGLGIGLQYRLRLYKQYKRLQLFNTYGFGAIYSTKPFDYINNPNNVVIGSKIAALINLELGAFYRLNGHSKIGIMASAWHVSNMHTELPNVGLNSPMISASLLFNFHSDTTSRNTIKHLPIKGWEFNVRAVYGRNEAGTTTRPTNGPKYSKYIGVFGISYRFRTIHRFSIDLEGYYDAAYRLHNEIGPYYFDHQILRSSALMLMFGHEFIHGHFGLVTHVGINLYNPTLKYLQQEVNGDGGFRLSQLIPVRVAARYYVFKPENKTISPYFQFGVKSNFGGADYLEFGVGALISRH